MSNDFAFQTASGEYKKYVRKHIDRIAELEAENKGLVKQCDELLAALEKYIDTGIGNSTDLAKQCKAYDSAIQVIYKIKGSAK